MQKHIQPIKEFYLKEKVVIFHLNEEVDYSGHGPYSIP